MFRFYGVRFGLVLFVWEFVFGFFSLGEEGVLVVWVYFLGS